MAKQDGKDTSKKTKVYKKLRNKYRLVLLREETFEERLSLRLTPLNVVTFIGLTIIFLIVFVTAVISFTGLREYIPGYSDVAMKRNAAYAVFKADSLERELELRSRYVQNIRQLLSGEIPVDSMGQLGDTSIPAPEIKDFRSRADSQLRENVEQAEKYVLNTSASSSKSQASMYFFFTPVEGIVTSSFSPEKDHYGVDVVTKESESVKAVLDGTVLFAGWTPENGYVIQIHHRNNLVSVYKHCSMLMKKKGQFVSAGEALAMVGSTGEYSTGPHLHFELWEDGNPINPEDYITF